MTVEVRGSGIRISYSLHKKRVKTLLDLPPTPAGILQAESIQKKYRQAARKGINPIAHQPTEAGSIKEYISTLFVEARKRAAKKGIEYTLTADDEKRIKFQHSYRCALTNVPFSLDRMGFNRTPYAPSLDRIDSQQGYTRENVRLVCTATNYAMNEWGEGVFSRLALGYTATFLDNQILK